MEVLIHLENGQTVVAEIHKHDKDGFVYLRPYATVEGRDISLMLAEPGAYREMTSHDDLAAKFLDYMHMGKTDYNWQRTSWFLRFEVLAKIDTELPALARRLWTIAQRDYAPDAEETHGRHAATIDALVAGQKHFDHAALLALIDDCLEMYEDNPREPEV
jgi:hypothetical protein